MKALLISTTLWCQCAAATSLVDRPVGKLYKDSDLVVFGRLTSMSASCDEVICAPIEYEIKIKENAQIRLPMTSGKILKFCATAPLTLGANYFLFLRKPPRATTDDKSVKNQKRCDLQATHDAIFFPAGGDVYRLWANDSVDNIESGGKKFLTYGLKEPAFYEQLEKVLVGARQKQDVSRLTIPGPWHIEHAMSQPKISIEQEVQCADADGKIEQTGLRSFACVYPAPDAGKICTDTSQCQAFCMTSIDTPAGTHTTGKCSSRVNGNPTGNLVQDEHAFGDTIVD